MKSTAVALMFGFSSKRAARLLTELAGRGGTESALSRGSGPKAAAGCVGRERMSPTMVRTNTTNEIAKRINVARQWESMF